MTRRETVFWWGSRRDRARRQAAVLLEVLLALALFVAAAAVATSALNSSLQSVERQKLSTQALNHAASVLAELQLGIRPVAALSRRPLDPPYQDWSCEVELTPSESADGGITGLARVEVIIRHQQEPVVRRLAEVLRIDAGHSTNAPVGVSVVP